MSNMIYCRFQNTLADLRECEEWMAENEPTELSEDEVKAYKRLVTLCKRIGEEYA